MPASTLVGRKANGGIGALTPAEAKAVLAIGVADVTGAAPLAAPAFTGTATFAAATINGSAVLTAAGLTSSHVTTALTFTPANDAKVVRHGAKAELTSATVDANRDTGLYRLALGGASDALMELGGFGGSTPRVQLRWNYADEFYFRATRDTETQWDGGPFRRIWHNGNLTKLSDLTNDSGFITGSGHAFPKRSDGTAIAFHWSGQGGQPTWLWGGDDGVNMYVYNPSNFSVNYATSANSATYLQGYSLSVGNHGGHVVLRSAEGYVYATNYRLESDRRLKERIMPLDGRFCLDALLAIGGFSYLKHDRGRSREPVRELGHIAQDVEPFFPDLVDTDEDGFKTLAPMSAPIVAAIGYLVRRLRQQGIDV